MLYFQMDRSIRVCGWLARPDWKGRAAPVAQLRRLRAIAEDEERPEAWRRAAQLLVERLKPVA